MADQPSTPAAPHVIEALADPTRRAIVEALRAGPQPVCVIAGGLPVSRPAVSQHLKVLTDAGLARVTPRGNRRYYELAPEGVDSLRRYLDQLWDDALAAFARAAHRKSKE
ncbi:ArsR/SmtB family transcription factor [Pelagovum pacificum]|uniref:Winged helix-turn-helix transcriptional regulator n=1 Tax=Pelagovum pacificum TaxID=2588711 RepID=A0A5C5GF64_9RHOB|nr:metalloregulator ArsR/SmtB family transcription factor [Pelagovum pacificum]QQA44067.1 winged helix-turn-helix transcriptional regulator [Pelagovum pacificum]TNY32804.1 winged helix-turn-helix transcriptional regulator [Pelagovum pacificum]